MFTLIFSSSFKTLKLDKYNVKNMWNQSNNFNKSQEWSCSCAASSFSFQKRKFYAYPFPLESLKPHESNRRISQNPSIKRLKFRKTTEKFLQITGVLQQLWWQWFLCFLTKCFWDVRVNVWFFECLFTTVKHFPFALLLKLVFLWNHIKLLQIRCAGWDIPTDFNFYFDF